MEKSKTKTKSLTKEINTRLNQNEALLESITDTKAHHSFINVITNITDDESSIKYELNIGERTKHRKPSFITHISNTEEYSENATLVGLGAKLEKLEWKKIIEAAVDPNSDLYIELNTEENGENVSLKPLPMVDLVLAVQTAVKIRQEVLENWEQKCHSQKLQIDELMSRLRNYEDSIQSKEYTVSNLNIQINNLKNELLQLNGNNAKFYNERETMKNEILKKTQLITELENQIQRQRNVNFETEQVKERLMHTLQLTESTRDQLKADCQSLENQIAKHLNSLGNNEKQFKHLHNEIIILKTQLDASQQEIDSLNKREDKTTELNASITKLKIHEKELMVLRSNETTLKESLLKAQNVIDKLINDKKDFNKTIAKLQNEFQLVSDEKYKVELSNNSLKNSINKMENFNKDIVNEKESLRIKLEKIEISVSKYESELNRLIRVNEDLKDEINRDNNERYESDSLQNELKNQCEKLQSEIVLLSNRYQQVISERHSVVTRLAVVEDNKKQLESEVIRLTSDYEASQSTIKDLRQSLAKNENQLNAANNNLTLTVKELSSLRQLLEIETTSFLTNGGSFIEKSNVDNDPQINVEREKILQKIEERVKQEIQRQTEWHKSEIYCLNKHHKVLIDELRKDHSKSLNDEKANAQMQIMKMESEIILLKNHIEIIRNELNETMNEASEHERKISDKFNVDRMRLFEQIQSYKREIDRLNEALDKQKHLDCTSEMDSNLISLLRKDIENLNDNIDHLQLEKQQLKIHIEQMDKDKNDLTEFYQKEVFQLKNNLLLNENTIKKLKMDVLDFQRKIVGNNEIIENYQNEILIFKDKLSENENQLENLRQVNNNFKYNFNKLEVTKNDYQSQVYEGELKCNEFEMEIANLYQRISQYQLTADNLNESLQQHKDDKQTLNEQLEKLNKEYRNAKDELEKSIKLLSSTQQQLEDLIIQHNKTANKLKEGETSRELLKDEIRDLNIKLAKSKTSIDQMHMELKAAHNANNTIQSNLLNKINNLENSLVSSKQETYENRESSMKYLNEIETLYARIDGEEMIRKELEFKFAHLRAQFGSLIDKSEISLDEYQTDNKSSDNNDWINNIIEKYKARLNVTEEDIKKNIQIVHNLEQEIKRLKTFENEHQEYLNLQQQFNNQTVTIQSHIYSNQMIEREKVSLIERNEKLEKQLITFEENNLELKDQIMIQHENFLKLDSEKRSLIIQLEKTEAKLAHLHVKNLSLDGQIEQLNILIKESSDNKNLLSNSAEAIQHSDQLVNELNVSPKTTSQQLINLQKDFNLKNLQLQELNSRINRLLSKQSEHENNEINLKQQINRMESELLKANYDKDSLKESIERLQIKENHWNDHIKSIEDKLKDANIQISQYKSERTEMESKLYSFQLQVMNYGKIDNLTEVQTQLIDSQLVKQQTDKENLIKKNLQLEKEKSTLQSILKKAENRLDIVENELKRCLNIKTELDESINNRDQEILNLKNKLLEFKNNIKDFRQSPIPISGLIERSVVIKSYGRSFSSSIEREEPSKIIEEKQLDKDLSG